MRMPDISIRDCKKSSMMPPCQLCTFFIHLICPPLCRFRFANHGQQQAKRGILFKKAFPPWDHGFFSSRFTEDVSGAEHLAQRQDRKPLCKSHAFNIIQLQLGSSDKIWFKVTRGDQNASLKVVQAPFYKMDSRIIKGDVFGTVGLKSHVLQRFGARECSWDRYSGVVSVRSHRHQITMIWNIIVGIYWGCF